MTFFAVRFLEAPDGQTAHSWFVMGKCSCTLSAHKIQACTHHMWLKSWVLQAGSKHMQEMYALFVNPYSALLSICVENLLPLPCQWGSHSRESPQNHTKAIHKVQESSRQQQTPAWLSLTSASKHKAGLCLAVPPAAFNAPRLSPLLVTELIPPSPHHAFPPLARESNRPGCLPPWPPHGCHGDGRLPSSALIESDFPPTASNKWSKITQPTSRCRDQGALGGKGPLLTLAYLPCASLVQAGVRPKARQ